MTALAFAAALGRNLLEGGAGDDELTASIVAGGGGEATAINDLSGGGGNDVLSASTLTEAAEAPRSVGTSLTAEPARTP